MKTAIQASFKQGGLGIRVSCSGRLLAELKLLEQNGIEKGESLCIP